MASTSGEGTQGPEDEVDTSFDPSELSPVGDWRQISEGGYSEVYKAWLLGATVAVKQASSRKKTSGEALPESLDVEPLAVDLELPQEQAAIAPADLALATVRRRRRWRRGY